LNLALAMASYTGGALLAAASIEGVSVGGRELLAFTADVRTNSVIAVGTPEYLLLVEQLIQELDSESVEQRINRVITLKNAEVETVEAALRSFIDSELKRLSELGEEAALRRMEREVSVVAHKETNQLMLSVSPRYESQIMQLVNELDQPPPQVMIQALLVEITLSNRLEMGLEFAIQDLLFSETAVAGRNNTLQSNNFDVVVGTDLGAAGSGLGGFSFTITGEDFSFLLRALQSESQVEVLSSPRILAMDNKEAEINIGQDVPFVRGVEFLETGQTRTQIEYENVGIILRVTPHINPDGFVIMEVEPEISSITSSTVPISEGVVAPIFNRNFVKTTITVKDGETAVIGGLITTNRDESENKVPILGDIPILGALFRATVRGDSKTELLIVLTPRVIRTVEDLRRQSVTERDKIDLLPETVRTSPLMEELQVQPERPGAVGEPQPSPGKPPERAPTRYELPEVQTYGPPKPLLVEMSADPKDASSADRAGRHDYEYYRRQRY
ncbi:MAG: secretin N-terminal domain-containing protein, partial [Phycisphaerae bacterium]